MRVKSASGLHDGLSVRERDLGLFLDSLGVKLSPADPVLPDDYAVIRLDPFAASLFDADDDKAVLLAYRIQGRVFPLSIVFLRGITDVHFCHSTLLLDS